MIKDQKGQALVESLFALPFLILCITAVLIGFLQLGAHYLTDHFTYQAVLCIASEKRALACKNELLKRLSLIPTYDHKLLHFNLTASRATAGVESKNLWGSTTYYKESIFLPITADHFREAQ